MAVAYPESFSVTEHERDALALTLGFLELKELPAWKRITDYMQKLVDEAEATRDENISSDAQLAWNLEWRFKQRKAMKLAIEKFVDDAISLRQQTLEDMERMRLAAEINEREETNL